ncbi:MAG: hypothetical protein HQM10_19240 [Candidatus Riflebacteria bacterium]|nr:hypothetical protein [Candidatus Riflebacteria bacterium]
MNKMKKIKTISDFSRIPDCILMDIGTGTKDILCFSAGRTLENNVKLVIPTPANILAEKIENENRDLKISGYTVGGGYLAKVLKHHCEKGFKLQMERMAALTVRNNLEEVLESGIEVCERIENPDYFFDEIELEKHFSFLKSHGENTAEISLVGISAQDHGFHTNEESSRKNRFKYFFQQLEKDPDPSNLVFTPENLPDVYGRLKSAVECVRKFNPALSIILIDTSFSAILGCPYDPRVSAISGPVLYINFGNGHTMACILYSGKIQAFFEHHTRLLREDPGKIKDFMVRMCEGKLTSEEVFLDEGNGCFTFEAQPFSKISAVVVTGPQRVLMASSGIEGYIEASPAGDMMMTGPIGLLKGYALRDKKH